MDSIKLEDGSQNDILREQVKFYKDIYRKKRDFNETKAADFVQNLNIPSLNEDQK